MSGKGGALVYPTADQVALAVVTACQLTKEHPLTIAAAPRLAARAISLAALRIAYPKASWAALGACVGYGRVTAQPSLASARRRAGWSEEAVDEVVGALVADDYGEQAR